MFVPNALLEHGEPVSDFLVPLMPGELTPEQRHRMDAGAEKAVLELQIAAETITRQAVVARGAEMGLPYRLELVAEHVRQTAMAGTVEKPAESTAQQGALYFSGFDTALGRYPDDALAFRQEQLAHHRKWPWTHTLYGYDKRFAGLYPR